MNKTKEIVKTEVDDSKIEGRKGGRPLIWSEPHDLEVAIDKFYDECVKSKRPFTLSGLAIELGVYRETLTDYGKRDKFVRTIKRAKLMSEQFSEEFLYSGKTPVGAIFALKNNHKWKDTHDINVSGHTTVDHMLTTSEQAHDDARLSSIEGEIVDDEDDPTLSDDA